MQTERTRPAPAKIRAMTADAPTAERLLDVRTPAELAFSPDESRVAFALHATVADVGSFVPSDLYVVDVDGDEPPRPAHERGVERPDARPGRRTARGWRSSRIGSRPGISCRTRWSRGGEPALAGTLTGSAESVAWSSDGTRLLVLVADPGCYGLDWSARAVTGAAPPHRSRRSGVRGRPATALPDRSRVRRRRGGRPARHGACGSSTGTATTLCVAIVSERPLRRIRLVPRGRRAARPRRAHRPDALRADVADRVARALARRAPRRR